MRIDPAVIATVDAAAIVVDRENADDVIPHLVTMGGGWKNGAEMWTGSRAQYLILVAANKRRILTAAPIAIMVMDTESLKQGVEYACQLLSDVKCLWVRICSDEAHRIVGQTVLSDCIPGGNA